VQVISLLDEDRLLGAVVNSGALYISNWIRLSDSIFQHCHRVPHVLCRRLDVVGRCGAYVRVPKDSLNHHFGDSQAVKIAPQATPGRVPAAPSRRVLSRLKSCPAFWWSDSAFRQTSQRFIAGRRCQKGVRNHSLATAVPRRAFQPELPHRF
jgi:hypothetical protein